MKGGLRVFLVILVLVGVGIVNGLRHEGPELRRPPVDSIAGPEPKQAPPPPADKKRPPPGKTLPGASASDPEFTIKMGVPSSSTGTAFAIDDSGVWMTAQHVVRGCTKLGILTEPTRGMKVGRVFSEPDADVSVIWTGSGAPPLSLTLTADKLRIGQNGFHLGYPTGKPGDAASLLLGRRKLRTIGVRKPFVEPVIAWSEQRRLPNYKTLGGMSGGPVLDADGEVVGVTVAASVRRGRIFSAAPASLARAINDAGLRLADVSSSAALDERNFTKVGNWLRDRLSVAKVVCLVETKGRRRRRQ